MPLATDGVWTPEEAESAFTAFGNLFLQVITLQRVYGTGEMENPQAAGTIVRYLAALPDETFGQLCAFLASAPELIEEMAMLAGLEVLRREMARQWPS